MSLSIWIFISFPCLRSQPRLIRVYILWTSSPSKSNPFATHYKSQAHEEKKTTDSQQKVFPFSSLAVSGSAHPVRIPSIPLPSILISPFSSIQKKQLTSTSQTLKHGSQPPPAIAPHLPLNPSGENARHPVPSSKPFKLWTSR